MNKNDIAELPPLVLAGIMRQISNQKVKLIEAKFLLFCAMEFADGNSLLKEQKSNQRNEAAKLFSKHSIAALSKNI